MATQFEGKVAFITGAARGQGRSHAVRFAEEGADILALDLCEQINSVAYPLARPEDMDETVNLVEKTGRRIVAAHGDVRDFDSLKDIVARGVSELGRIDYVFGQCRYPPSRRCAESDDFGVRRRSRRDAQRGVQHHRSRAAGTPRA